MFILCLLISTAYAQNTLQINTTEGIVAGAIVANSDYYAFYGIPYAGPASGENRFKAPTPPTLYTGVFNATNNNIICAQPDISTNTGLIRGDENCLTLSIFTRNVTTPKPVFVWLNVEEYTSTKTVPFSYKNFVDKNTVFVSLNFRVSIFGFLCLRVTDAPGNAGLKDIIQGLTWVKTNIANFGGDPNNVVLIGHGSGAALVDILTMSRRSENLIHKAIALSGSALASWAVAYDPIGYANLFGAKLTDKAKTPQELVTLLKTADINLIARALNDFRFTNNTPLFAPCLENPNLNPNETVLLDAPINILRSGNFIHIPYIAGYTTREGTLRAREAAIGQWLSMMQANFTDFMPVDIDISRNASLAQNIRQFYFSGSSIDMSTINDYLDYHGDTLVLISVIRGAKERALTSSQSVRLLEFGYRGTRNSDWTNTQIPLTGARHGAFLNFLFNYDLKLGDEHVMASLVSRFSSFAVTGDPMPSPTSVTWPAISANVLNYIYYGGNNEINSTPIYTEESRVNPHTTRRIFWSDIYSNYYHIVPKAPSSANSAVVTIFLLFLNPIFCIFYEKIHM